MQVWKFTLLLWVLLGRTMNVERLRNALLRMFNWSEDLEKEH